MRILLCASLFLIFTLAHGISQTIDATLVKMVPQFPKVGEIVRLTLVYPNSHMRIQERIYSYKDSEEVVFEGVDFQRIQDSNVIITVRFRAKHGGIVRIPPIIENSVNTIRIAPISVLISFYKNSSLQTVIWKYPPFPFLEVLYMLFTIFSLIICIISFVAIVRESIPMLKSLLQRIYNTYNVIISVSIVKKLLHYTNNMEKPTFAHEKISSFDFYNQMYAALEIRFCFLYGSSFKTHTMKEIEVLLLYDIQHVITQHQLPEQKRISQEMLHDFFITLTEVLYGKKLSELSVRINHCHVLLRLFFISKYIFNAQKMNEKNENKNHDNFSLAHSLVKRSSSK